MNIKISIKDCDCPQSITNNKEISEVEHRKRTMLYAPPENDNKNSKQTVRTGNNRNEGQTKKNYGNLNMNSKQYRESQREMLNQLKKNGQNQATVNMIQTSNHILQKQNEILQQNQRVLHNVVNKNKGIKQQQGESQTIRKQVTSALDQIQNQVVEIKKMRNQITTAVQQFNKNVNQFKNGKARQEIPSQISNMNSNMKNLVQVSQNHLEGLENMEALKSLQNFNMEGYNQAINTLKKQIAQYLKQSQSIERQLKIRTAKLQKLQVPPKFEQQLYKPYQEHLVNRVKNIDLHAIRDRVYDKIGGFDYGKFEADVNNIMLEARNQLANFPIICKEYQIVVPEVRIDQKELKNLDMKLPSVLDEYKAARGIKFDDPKKPTKESEPSQANRTVGSGGLARTNQLQERLKQTNSNLNTNSKKPSGLQRMASQPIDLAHQAKLTKQSDKRPTILQNELKKQKRQLQQRMHKGSKEKKKEDDQFEKYLENRAREELELIYKEKKERLQRMQNELYEEAKAPVYIDLNLRRQEVQPKKWDNKKMQQQKQKPKKQQEEEDQYAQQFEDDGQGQNKEKKEIIKEQPNQQTQHTDIKQLGRQILKEKLKNLLGERNRSPHLIPPGLPRQQQQNANTLNGGERQVQNIAEGFINMINNTLTQVNQNLARSIQKKIELNSERRPTSLERREQKKISIPKLEAFRPPPVFNVNLVQQPTMVPYTSVPMPVPVPVQPAHEPKKIVVENYDQYRLQNNENYSEYEISSEDQDDI